ncbi:MAG TPA: hypothetical protein VFH10_09040 [Nocardioides sp.]|uniref:hypothetical protein n=1 Tax=Nocardioides sp. TaxID=35761 RepID=UPI002D8083E4|nr:hypothetical protein [Nocardioides sp.]HET6652772.1 hypothetical protein [Nocardioides sp.]
MSISPTEQTGAASTHPTGAAPTTPPRVRKHLMTPGAPRRQNPERMSLSRVQRWVLSSLAATTILHLSIGLVVAAAFSDRLDAQIGLLVIGAAFGVIAFVAALIIHQHRLLSPWLLLGVVPSLVGALYIF